jgi:hypothetical protein
VHVFFYKLTHDSGAAPCVQRGLLSLAICKPLIRTSAQEGDLIFGFAANSLHADNRLIYIARVTDVLRDGRYYEEARFAGRIDRIHRRRNGVSERRKAALFHAKPADLAHDLGRAPYYPRATVLLSTDFRYFGGAGSADYKQRFAALGRVIAGLKQGHRLHHGAALLQQLMALKDEAWAAHRARQLGRPASPADPSVSLRGGSCGTFDGKALSGCRVAPDALKLQRVR